MARRKKVNNDAIKYNYDDKGNIIQLEAIENRTVQSDGRIHTNKIMVEGTLAKPKKILSALNPTTMNYVETSGAITQDNQYKVDYVNGDVYFHNSQIGTDIKTQFMFIGEKLGDAREIYVSKNSDGTVTKNLTEDFEDISKHSIPNIESRIAGMEDKKAMLVNTNIETGRYYKIISFDKGIPNGSYKIFITLESGNTKQIVEVFCAFPNNYQNVACKSPFVFSNSFIASGSGRLINQIKLMRDKNTKEVFIALKSNGNSNINGITRVDNYGGEQSIIPMFELYSGENEGFNMTNYFSQDYADIETGFRFHSHVFFENQLNLKDNLVVNDDIVVNPESDQKYSAIRLNDSSSIINVTGKYSATLGYYLFSQLSKYRLFASGKRVYLQVGEGGQEETSKNGGFFDITGWLGEDLEEMLIKSKVVAFNGDIRLDGRGGSGNSSIFLFGNNGYSQIQQNINTDELELSNSNGSINIITVLPHETKINGRSVLSAQSVTKSTRPTNIMQGYSVFDREVGKPIWWDGTKWIDANATQV